MDVSVLGPVEVGGSRVAGQLERRLVAALVLYRAVRLTRDRLIDIMWGEHPPRTAENSLYSKISRLRTTLGSDCIARAGNGYELDTSALAVDVIAFDRTLGRCSDDRAPPSLLEVEAALALWRGDPYAELPDDDLARAETARLGALLEDGHVRRLRLLADGGRYDEIVDLTSNLIATRPLWEAVRVARLEAMNLCGRRAEALAEVVQYRSLLCVQTGGEPGRHLVEAEAAIRRATAARSSASDRASQSWDVGTLPDQRATRQPWLGDLRVDRAFVGRERVRAQLLEFVQDTVQGSSRVVLVEADAGLGKSRVLEEAVRAAELAGMAVVEVSGHDGFRPPMEAVRTALDALGVRQAAMPRAGADDPNVALAVEYGLHAGVAAVVDAIVSDATAAPVALLVDDAHLLDPASAQALRALATVMVRRGGPQRRVLLVIAARPGAVEADNPYLRGIGDGHGRRSIRLPALSRLEVASLVEHSTGRRASEAALRHLHVWAGGNPTCVVGILRHLTRCDGGIWVEDGLLQFDAEEVARASTHGLVAHLIALPESQVTVLERLALLRPRTKVADAARLIGHDRHEVIDALNAADRAGIARLRDGVVVFSHDAYRHELLARRSSTERSLLHTDIAERLGQPLDDAELLTLAWHLRHGCARDTRQTRRVFLEAAEISFAHAEWFEATHYFDLALPPQYEGDLMHLMHAGLAAFRSHEHHKSVRYFDRALRAADRIGDVRAWAHVQAAKQRANLTSTELPDPNLGELTRAVRRLDRTSDGAEVVARVSALGAEAAAMTAPEAVNEWMNRARAASRYATTETRAYVEFAGALADITSLRLRDSAAGLGRALTCAEGAVPWVQSWAESRLAYVLAWLGEGADAHRRCEQALRTAERYQGWADLALASAVEASLLAVERDWEASLVSIARAEAALQRSAYPFVAGFVLLLRAFIETERGDADAARSAVARVEQAQGRPVDLWRLVVASRRDGTFVDPSALRALRLPTMLSVHTAPRVVGAAILAVQSGNHQLGAACAPHIASLVERGAVRLPSWPVPLRELHNGLRRVAATEQQFGRAAQEVTVR